MKIICIGRNYEDNVTELQNERPDSPVIFIKPDSSIILKNQPFFIPDYSNEINYEIEVILKICKLGKSIENKFAKIYYDQVGLGIDFTARDLQFELKSKGLPWEKAKAFDGSALIGNWINKREFKNLNEILDMGGHGIYVWSVYLIGISIIVISFLIAKKRINIVQRKVKFKNASS